MNSFQEKTNIALDEYGIKPLFKGNVFLWKSFEEARKFARSLNLKSGKEWDKYHKKNKPEGTPRYPNEVYKDKGWNGCGGFLGKSR